MLGASPPPQNEQTPIYPRSPYGGNLEARRDWGYARDHVEAMWLMLRQPEGDDFVIGTGEAHSVRELCEEAFGHVGLDGREFVEIDPRYHMMASDLAAREQRAGAGAAISRHG